MATSGTKTFSLNTADVIEEAYELAGLELSVQDTTQKQLDVL